MIKIVSKYIERVKNCNFINQKEVPKKQGVYLIFQKNKIIYVGESVNLYKRINSQHISGSKTNKTSTFKRLLCDKYNKKPGIKLREWIIANCRFKYVEIRDSDLCHLVEKALIYELRKKCSLLNK